MNISIIGLAINVAIGVAGKDIMLLSPVGKIVPNFSNSII